MRTTSSLEANNRCLNDNIINHGNFFTFVHDLRLEEYSKSVEFERFVTSGGQSKAPRDKYKASFSHFKN